MDSKKFNFAELEEKYSEAQENIQRERELNTLLLSQLHSAQEELEYRVKKENDTVYKITDLERRLTKYKQKEKCLLNELTWLRTVVRFAHELLWKRSWSFRRKIKKDVQLISERKTFDREFYISSYPDIKFSKLSPEEHYLLHGAYEGRKPSDKFETLYYIHAHADIAQSGVQPIIHFLKFGEAEERRINKKGD
ncbi:hypothetical protein CA267_012410 [Alteromonas pelagimontana]|uniref:Uncharacterized protein n=1 Tax=Alteromonas pelagimontana TaxID=1858656 RepID=A0A6M4MH71_9ALTE|nr:hypothetical protein [Alteromonas pelagimontana]QJR81526.1 hypothetical protein CA267_012410 [Alteromonas pelagimontana]